jgi:hypothetical protein
VVCIGLCSLVQAMLVVVVASVVGLMKMVVGNRGMLLVCKGLVECMLCAGRKGKGLMLSGWC